MSHDICEKSWLIHMGTIATQKSPGIRTKRHALNYIIQRQGCTFGGWIWGLSRLIYIVKIVTHVYDLLEWSAGHPLKSRLISVTTRIEISDDKHINQWTSTQVVTVLDIRSTCDSFICYKSLILQWGLEDVRKNKIKSPFGIQFARWLGTQFGGKKYRDSFICYVLLILQWGPGRCSKKIK